MQVRFWMAMASYAVLALAAALTLDRIPRTLVWLLLGALAVRTWIAAARKSD